MSRDWQNKSDSVIASELESLFKKFWPRKRKVPNSTACYAVAIALKTVAFGEAKGKRDQGNTQKVEEKTELQKLGKHGRAFIRSAEKLKLILKKEIQSYNIDIKSNEPLINNFIGYYTRTLNDIENTSLEINKLIKNLSQNKPNDPIVYFDKAVERAWGNTGEKVPKSPAEEGPRCGFLKEALELVGMNFSTALISDRLKGRVRTRTS